MHDVNKYDLHFKWMQIVLVNQQTVNYGSLFQPHKVNCDILSLTFSPRNCEKTRENCDKKCQLPFVFFYSVSETKISEKEVAITYNSLFQGRDKLP